MKKYLTILGGGAALGFAALLAVGLSSGDANSQDKMKMMFGDKGSVAFSKDLWAALSKARLAGKNAINSRPYEGQAPHGAILQTIDTTVSVKGRTGRVIVKNNFGPAGITTNDVWTNPKKHLKAVTVMFKRESGYDKDNKDWFWAKFTPNGGLAKNPKGMMLAGRVAKGMDKGCIACHSGAGGGDYLFINDK
ncbi:hypothetical protein MnTg02_00122 [bacterium MnTg02]|nr:hypothetical protein MnTg02_00122 [bacterium MnTg02]